MDHGRDHQQRQAHARPARANNVPTDSPETELEAEFLLSGRDGGKPRQGVIGAHVDRPGYSQTGTLEEGEEPVGRGADVKPTRN